MTAEYVRLVGRRQVQTSMRTFNHPDTGRQVTVIGTYHLGQASYFAQLGEAIDKLQANGAVVQCEGSRLMTCDESSATADERTILAQLRRADALRDQRLAELGWAEQIAGLQYPPSWQVVDLNYLQIIRELGMPLAHTVARRKLSQFDWPDHDRDGLNRMQQGIALLMRIVSQDRHLIKVAASREPADEVMVEARNAVALNGVAGTDRDVVVIWGLAHLPGLDAGLIEQGFVRSGAPRWYSVASLPTTPNAPATAGSRATLSTDAVQWYAEGDSIRAIARQTGRSYGFIHRLLVDEGVRRRRRGRQPNPTRAREPRSLGTAQPVTATDQQDTLGGAR